MLHSDSQKNKNKIERMKRKRKRKILKTKHNGFSGGQKVPNFPSNVLEP